MARSRGAAWPEPRLARPRHVRRRCARGPRSRGVRRRCAPGHRFGPARRPGHGRRCGHGGLRGRGRLRGCETTTRVGRGLRRLRDPPPGHVVASRWPRRVRGPTDPTGRRHRVEDHVSGARSGRRRRGARRTGEYPKNSRPGNCRRRNASYEARWDAGFGCPGRIRGHRGRRHLCHVRPRHRRPSAEHSRSGCRRANRRLMRLVPAGSRTGCWSTRGILRLCRRDWWTENLVRRRPAWDRLPAVTGHPSVRPDPSVRLDPGAPQAPARPLAIRRRRRPGELC